VGVVIRGLLSGDRDVVCRMLQTCGIFTPEEVSVALELVDDAIAKGSRSDYIAFVSVRDDIVCGYVCIGRTPMTASTWHLYWACVDASAQRGGVGRRLHAHVESFVRRMGGERLVVETSSQPSYDRARRFYEAGGYVQVGRIPDFYKPHDDCILYRKEFVS
jgi:ribosomal protein S18 acetylase RimI-like enzyme